MSTSTKHIGKINKRLKLVGENISQPDLQLHKDGFQLVQSQMMLAMLNPKKRLVGNANLFGKAGV